MSASGWVALYLHDTPSIIVTDGDDTVEIANMDTVFADQTEIDNIVFHGPDIDGVGRVAYSASIAAEGTVCDDRILLSGLNPPIVLATGDPLCAGVVRCEAPTRHRIMLISPRSRAPGHLVITSRQPDRGAQESPTSQPDFSRPPRRHAREAIRSGADETPAPREIAS